MEEARRVIERLERIEELDRSMADPAGYGSKEVMLQTRQW